MLSRHRLSRPDFDALAQGLGSAATIAALRPAQLSMRLLALRAVLDSAERGGYREHVPGLDLLCAVQQRDRSAVNEVLCYPFIGSWAARCLRLLSDGARSVVEIDLAHLNGIAAAAAIRACMPFRIEVPVRDGAVYLPTLGRMLTAGGPTSTLRGDGGEIVADGAPLADSVGWQPLRRIKSVIDGQALAVVLDDVDPFRGGPRLPVAPRLDDAAVRGWEDSLGQAWGILVRHHPGYAGAIGAGLTAVVPLVAPKPNRGVNATSRESFGAAAISPVSDPVMLAVGILHEFQHGKLNAVLDLVMLHTPDEKKYYAPWRQDPRPLGGLLHGTYADVGVCDFWRAQTALTTEPFPGYGQMEFARWSDRTARALDLLLESGGLTPLGECLVRGLRERLRTWLVAVPEEPDRLARIASADHRLGWRLRNSRPDAAAVDVLARAWRTGAQTPVLAVATDAACLIDGGSALGSSSRQDLLHLRLRDPDRLASVAHSLGIERADAELACGNTEGAAAGYLAWIRQEPRCADAWAGLALALGETHAALLHAPELVCAVYNRLLADSGPVPDPGVLAEWLTPTVPADPFQLSDQVYPSRTR